MVASRTFDDSIQLLEYVPRVLQGPARLCLDQTVTPGPPDGVCDPVGLHVGVEHLAPGSKSGTGELVDAACHIVQGESMPALLSSAPGPCCPRNCPHRGSRSYDAANDDVVGEIEHIRPRDSNTSVSVSSEMSYIQTWPYPPPKPRFRWKAGPNRTTASLGGDEEALPVEVVHPLRPGESCRSIGLPSWKTTRAASSLLRPGAKAGSGSSMRVQPT